MQTTNIGTQKIDGTIFKTFKIMVIAFSITGQADRIKFFKKTFLMTNVSPDVVFEMLFFTLSSANFNILRK